MLPKSADVVIIGGGVNGLSTAFHLAQLGCTNVVVLEKEDAIATQSTGLSAGGIRQQFSTSVNIRMARYSVDVLERFTEITGRDPEFRQAGYLFLLTDPGEVEMFRRSVALQHSLGVKPEWLEPDEIVYRWPHLAVDDMLAATCHEPEGYADPYAVAEGYAAAARKAGVRVLVSAMISSRLGKWRSASVTTIPALTALTRMPRGASSAARCLTTASSAALEAPTAV